MLYCLQPDYFQPFSMGKRSCIGYKMVQNIAFSLVANLMLHFNISSPQWSPEDIPLGMVALPPQPFQFTVSSASAYFSTNLDKINAFCAVHIKIKYFFGNGQKYGKTKWVRNPVFLNLSLFRTNLALNHDAKNLLYNLRGKSLLELWVTTFLPN